MRKSSALVKSTLNHDKLDYALCNPLDNNDKQNALRTFTSIDQSERQRLTAERCFNTASALISKRRLQLHPLGKAGEKRKEKKIDCIAQLERGTKKKENQC